MQDEAAFEEATNRALYGNPNGKRMNIPSDSTVCDNCGLPAHEHEKGRANHGGGRWSWNYYCPA